MASIIISDKTMKEVPEINMMVNELLKGNIDISRFIKFLNDNDLKSKVIHTNKDVNSPKIDDFISYAFSEIFSIPKKSEYEDTEENDDDKEVEDEKFDEIWKKDIKDNIDFIKHLVDDYGDSEEDDIDHIKAVKLFNSMMVLGRTYRKRANKGDKRYHIPNFTPESILKFIESLNLPIDKIEKALERGKSNFYKSKKYEDFDDFVTNMKDVFGIEDVWNPSKEVPEWFESIRNKLYRESYPTEDILIDESEWNEFKKWKEENNKKSSTSKKIPVSDSVKTNKTTVKKSTSKSTKTDREAKLKEFKEYADYILLNSVVEDDAKDLLLSYAANMDERCKNLYEYLVDLKKNNKSAKLIKYLNEATGNTNIAFVDLVD